MPVSGYPQTTLYVYPLTADDFPNTPQDSQSVAVIAWNEYPSQRL